VHDAQQPGFDELRITRLGDTLVCSDARLLHEILGVGTITCKTMGGAKQRVEVRLDQGRESPGVWVRHNGSPLIHPKNERLARN
jgi:hypothetical protein